MSDVLSATDNDAVFIRCDVSVPEEVGLGCIQQKKSCFTKLLSVNMYMIQA